MDIKEKLKAIHSIVETGHEHDQVIESWVLVSMLDALIHEEEANFHYWLSALQPIWKEEE